MKDLASELKLKQQEIRILNQQMTELLRRFESLEKELKAVKIAHAVAEDIMHTNFALCKSSAEHWKMMVKDLMCCGNCHNFYRADMAEPCRKTFPFNVCKNWQTDGLSREEREGK